MGDIAASGSLLAMIRQRLEAERRALARQIGSYPPPITGCDAQFNHLLDRRAGLARELRQLEGIAPRDDAAVAAFIAASASLDPAAKARLLARPTLHDAGPERSPDQEPPP